VRSHHEPSGATDTNKPIAAILALGNQMALDRKVGIGTPESLADATAQAMEILKLTPESLEGHQAAIAEALEQDKSMISEF